MRGSLTAVIFIIGYLHPFGILDSEELANTQKP